MSEYRHNRLPLKCVKQKDTQQLHPPADFPQTFQSTSHMDWTKVPWRCWVN